MRPDRRAPRTAAARVLAHAALSALSGGLLTLAFPAPDVWVLAFVGVGGMLVALRGHGFGAGFLIGTAGGLAFWLTLISWTTLFLGVVPWLALSVLESLFMGLGGGLIALAWRWTPVVFGRLGRLVVAPLVVAAVWTAREEVSGTWPYGGFAWGRIALSQASSPVAPLAAWFGLAGMSFVLVAVVAVAVAAGAEALDRDPAAPLAARRLVPRLVVAAAAVTALLLGMASIPAFRPSELGSLRIGLVQADTKSGYFQRTAYVGQILDQNIAASLPLAGRGAQLIVWPEGASDISPLADPATARKWDEVATIEQAPLLAGAITARDGRYYNSSLLWEAGQGVVAVYDKVHPVPFGEYVPDRAFWRPFAPSLIDLVGRDYTPGTRSSVISVDGAPVGVDICFDIVDDGLILGSVQDGAEVLIAQTNNADFGTTEESRQQFAIARMRAIETGRSVVTDSTVAATAAIGPDGAVLAALPSFTKGSLLVEVPRAVGITPAVAFGVPLGAAISVFGVLAALIVTGLGRPMARAASPRARRRGRRPGRRLARASA